ncbi:MAG: sigma 54-dependent Fis family transcriptional regulator [Myxococcaceae bacterium]|nr:sigma 54-dependent Fis family transcriptional regulator [Myxococcaceae bacterium]
MKEPQTRSISGEVGSLPERIRLSARLDGRELASHVFSRGVLTVGSAEGNDLVVPDDTVSRRHLELSTRGGSLFVKDLSSRNGVRLAGSRVGEAFVGVGSVLVLGNVELRVEDGVEGHRVTFGPFESTSPAMIAALEALKRVASTETTVLLEAETGSGKDVTARALHHASDRRAGPFETLDCSALPKELAAAELFGHVKGAFTGAERARPGVFERADGGTVFLDEIGELPLDLQPMLLRALESREIRRVGDEKPRRIDVRVIAATNRDLDDEVKAGRFRADLLHRLAVVRIRVPPLRERLDDLPLLVRGILEQLGPRARGFAVTPGLLQQLRAHTWPGNVRELKNLIERALALGDVALPATKGAPPASAPQKSIDYHQAREDALGAFEHDFIVHLLRTFDGNVSKAAREAGLDRVYLHKLIKKHGIDVERV